ncbi:MAG: hypothetical protein WD004_04895 [Actinomycetota bacterium]
MPDIGQDPATLSDRELDAALTQVRRAGGRRGRATVALIAALLVLGGIAYVMVSAGAESRAKSLAKTAAANDAMTESAPQQEVAASWGIRDASIEQVRQSGIRNGLLAAVVVLLVSILLAILLAGRERSRFDT